MNRRHFLQQCTQGVAGAAIAGSVSAIGAETTETVEAQSSTSTTGGPDSSSLRGKIEPSGVFCWLESSLRRVYPSSLPRRHPFQLQAARNERISFQVCLRNATTFAADTKVSLSADDLKPIIRRVGFVPMRHMTADVPPHMLEGIGFAPGLVPDPLFPETQVKVGPYETQPFWITLTIPADLPPGERPLIVRIEYRDVRLDLPLTLTVMPLTVQPRRNFPVTNWWFADSLRDWYKADLLSEAFRPILLAYMKNMVLHGTNVQGVPLLQNTATILTERPVQLLRVTGVPGSYAFDFTGVKTWIDTARLAGAELFEFPHFYVSGTLKHPAVVYRSDGDQSIPLWKDEEVAADADPHRGFYREFLPALHRFLEAEKLLDRSLFHLADEPQEMAMDKYRVAGRMFRDLAPWMKTVDALHDPAFCREGLVDIPVPLISLARDFRKAGIPHWVYYCTAPRGGYVNRFLDTPLAATRMGGWLFYRLRAAGFLHWGHSYWYRFVSQELLDPFENAAGGAWPSIPYGDPFVVYPGKEGPIDSIRWEVFAEGLQDYALLQSAGISPDDDLLAPLKEYDDFPHEETWIEQARAAILKRARTKGL